ncbi:MAG: tetratricopeptide repeat protein [Calditrichaeota bacterium]|nr:tetratricopeptide repeat protein [Calditrichota bacterium]
MIKARTACAILWAGTFQMRHTCKQLSIVSVCALVFPGLFQGCLSRGYRNVYEAWARQDYPGVTRMVAEHPEPGAELCFLQGDANRNLRAYAEMLAAFQRCQELSSEYDALITNRQEVAWGFEHHELDSLVARNALEESAERFPVVDPLGAGRLDYLELKAFVLDSLRRDEEARSCYRQLLDSGQGDADRWSDRLVLCFTRDRMWNEALELVQSQLLRHPRELRYHLARITLFEVLQQHVEVVAAIQLAEGLFSDRLEFSMAVGVYYFNQRDWTTAAHYFDKVVTVDSTNPLAWYRLAQCLFNSYDFLEAQKNFDRVLQLMPDFLQIRSYYRVLALHLGREDDYARHFGEQLLEFDVSDLGSTTISDQDVDRLLRELEQPFYDAVRECAAARARPLTAVTAVPDAKPLSQMPESLDPTLMHDKQAMPADSLGRLTGPPEGSNN